MERNKYKFESNYVVTFRPQIESPMHKGYDIVIKHCSTTIYMKNKRKKFHKRTRIKNYDFLWLHK